LKKLQDTMLRHFLSFSIWEICNRRCSQWAEIFRGPEYQNNFSVSSNNVQKHCNSDIEYIFLLPLFYYIVAYVIPYKIFQIQIQITTNESKTWRSICEKWKRRYKTFFMKSLTNGKKTIGLKYLEFVLWKKNSLFCSICMKYLQLRCMLACIH